MRSKAASGFTLIELLVVIAIIAILASLLLPALSGAKAPGSSSGDLPTALWLPKMQTNDAGFGVQANQFGFNVNWASGMEVVVEACADLAQPVWSPLSTNTIPGGSSTFSDSEWEAHSVRFYRLRMR